jgi:hypothetical protein
LIGERRREHGLGWRRTGGGLLRSGLEHGLDRVALFRLQIAELVLDVIAGLLAHVEQDFGIDIQLARQDIDTDLLFLQRALLDDPDSTRIEPPRVYR